MRKTRSGRCWQVAKRPCRWYAFPLWTLRLSARALAHFYNVAALATKFLHVQYARCGKSLGKKMGKSKKLEHGSGEQGSNLSWARTSHRPYYATANQPAKPVHSRGDGL